MSFITQPNHLLPAEVAVGGDDVIANVNVEGEGEVNMKVDATAETDHRLLPWQLQWKRPQWHRIVSSMSTTTNTTNSTTSTKMKQSSQPTTTKKERGTPHLIGHASARITASEYVQYCLSEEEDIKHSANKHITNNADHSLLLNVAILQSGDNPPYNSSTNNRRHPNQPADTIIIDILRQTASEDTSNDKLDTDNDTTTDSSVSYETVQQQTLYWPNNTNRYGSTIKKNPTNASMDERQNSPYVKNHQTLTTTTSTFDGPCSVLFNHNPLFQLMRHVFVPRPAPVVFQTLPPDPSVPTIPTSRNSRTLHSKEDRITVTTGLIAVTLIRVPQTPYSQIHHHDHGDMVVHPERDDPIHISTADALDVLNLLSLQGNFGHPHNHRHYDADVNSSLDTTTDTTTMASIHAATMLNRDDVHNRQLQGEELDVATDLLLACLTNDGKVHLYSPWKLLRNDGSNGGVASNHHQMKSRHGMTSFWFGSNDGKNLWEDNNILPLRESITSIELSIPYLQKELRQSETTVLDESHRKQPQPPPPSFISMFDTSMWDATLDPTTLHHQTTNNIPTHCVSVHDEYVCIAGRGRKRWQYISQNMSNVDNDSTVNTENIVSDVNDTLGGFITFISTKTMSEKRTLFLPFVPTHISPFLWGAMKLLLVAGQGRAIAIRVDGGNVIVPAIPLSSQQNNEKSAMKSSLKHQSTVTIHRFQILPIEFSNMEYTTTQPTIVGGEALVSPPAMALIFDHDANHSNEGIYVVRQSLFSFETRTNRPNNSASHYQNRPDTAATVIITTHQHDTPTAWIPLTQAAHTTIWCQLGQGWCIVGAGRRSYFICYEGLNKVIGPVVKELSLLDVDDGDFMVHNSVLPAASLLSRHQIGPQDHDTLRGMFTTNGTTSSDVSGNILPEVVQNVEMIDDIIVEAMESISTLTHRENFVSNSPTSVSRRNRQLSLTTQEKSERLLRHCSSWTKLDQSFRSMSVFQSQTPSITLRTQNNTLSILSLRNIVVEHGPVAPFQQVLAWLSMQNDFFTAASIALSLLQDVESLRHLWSNCNKLGDDEKSSQLNGLLDGILPIGTDIYDATLTRLADMTVACLTKGGYAMSSTLEQFLSHNTMYDPARASLMLVASATGALSDDEAHVTNVMGTGYCRDENHLDCSLWPVRCLLKIGATRDRLGTVLLLLNTAIPDELRRRNRFGSRAASRPSLELCKSLITLIVETSVDSTEILLDLVDERSRLRFWESLDHETRLELSVISISGFYPLLHDQEIRSWILKELLKCIESEDLASAANVYDKTPTVWLRTAISGCIQNAGCKMELVMNPTLDEAKEDFVDSFGFIKYKEAIQKARLAATPPGNSGGMDFDILIPALLVLDRRNEAWHMEAESNTRTILNAVCNQAGRGTLDEPLFVMNRSVLMRQCYRLGDVEAAANLIGGRNGFILQICHTLNEELGMSMDDAERYALGESRNARGQHSKASIETFSICDCHRRLLMLLDEHVLKIRTYGEFTQSRGTVDPIFAATLFFRTWWAITMPKLQEATKWLTDWLRQQLGLSFFEKNRVSPHRLACAALIQALIWPQENDNILTEEAIDKTPLANKLEMDVTLLLQMTQSCCGMVEALPPNLFEYNENSGMVMVMKSSLTPDSKRNISTNETSINNRSEYDNDDSFVSAIGTFRDMDISHTTWNT